MERILANAIGEYSLSQKNPRDFPSHSWLLIISHQYPWDESTGIRIMSVSAPTATSLSDGAFPVRPEGRQSTPPEQMRDRTEQPPPRAPLPPGQGTRIDVLV